MSSSTCCALVYLSQRSHSAAIANFHDAQHAHVCLDLNMTLLNFSGMFSSLMIKTTHKKEGGKNDTHPVGISSWKHARTANEH